MATLEKVYECLNPNCKAQIRLEKRPDGGWNKFNLDNTPHVHPTKKQGQQQQKKNQQTFPKSEPAAEAPPAPPAPVASSLERKLDHLIAEVQALRMELQRERRK